MSDANSAPTKGQPLHDAKLNEVLAQAEVPERSAAYWEQFPARVTTEIQRRADGKKTSDTPARIATNSSIWSWAVTFRFLGTKPALAIGLAAVCLTLGFFLGFWRGHDSSSNDRQLAEVQKYYRELEALFPNQLQAIVFDQKGTRLVLAREPNLPSSTPLYVKVRGPEGTQRFVTFSGQQIRFNGEVCDVLTDREGHVLLVGHQIVWSSAQALAKPGQYRIEAQPLQATL